MSSMIWIPHPTEAWIPATVIVDKGTMITIRPKGSSSDTSAAGPLSKYDIVSEASLQEACDNLVDLESYSEGIILHHIRSRFINGSIYTFVGNILVAVNPYKLLDIYGHDVMEEAFGSIRRLEAKMRPHVFSIAAMTLASMRDENKNQCVLISGESGAGKTETTKKILQFISTMSLSSSSRGSISVESQILDSNPILESFGNAKTIRNNNSSRFGKYMEINFDKKNCIKGCNITSYLLEKTRVVRVATLERNYHIFYMLVSGSSAEQRREFNLRNADQFNYLTQGECITIDRRNDTDEFLELLEAMKNLGFDDKFQHDVFQTLAGILHLGNLEFSPTDDEGSVISSANDCKNIAKFIGLSDPKLLETTLCYRENIVGKEIFMIPLNPNKAKDQRDALAKYIYGRIFDIIVTNVNSSLFRGKMGNNIGILDIFGFEVFLENSFEQLCINYCNERLQTFFNEIIFEGEMKMYVADGVNCDDISYQDNTECVRLIDLKGVGIFSILDEQVILPGGTDEKFLQKLNQIFDENTSTKSPYYVRNRKKPKEFGISHFAGDVGYNVDNFLEKNKDALATGIVKLINSSQINFIHTPEAETERLSNGSSPSTQSTPAGRLATRMTLSAKFKLDLDNLMNTLRATTPYFIRCIKPNDYQAADRFDSVLTLNQLKYSGLFEAVSIRKAGYAIRMPHKLFIDRYKHCADTKPPNEWITSDPRMYCQALFEQMYAKIQAASGILPLPPNSPRRGSAGFHSQGNLRPPPPPPGPRPPPPPPPGHFNKGPSSTGLSSTIPSKVLQPWCVGNTRVYIRTQELKVKLDKYRVEKGGALVYQIQRLVRGYLTRLMTHRMFGLSREQKLKDKKNAEIERITMEKEDKQSLENEIIFRNDLEIQKKILEAKKARVRAENERRLKIAMASIVKIQKTFRGKLGRVKGRRYMVEKTFERAIESQAHEGILHALALQKKYNVTSKVIKSYQYHSKALILNIFNESYVINQLEDAISTANIQLLTTAIEITEKNNMMYLASYQTAKDVLERCYQRRQVIDVIEQELRLNTNTIPKLLCRIDTLQSLIHQAIKLGLAASEPIVHEAAIRISKVSNLLKLREELRHAVELCSESRMSKGIEERSKLCRIYGDDLFEGEYKAIVGMQRMLRYDKQICEQYRVDTILSKKGIDTTKPSTLSTTPTRNLYDLDDEDEEEEDDERKMNDSGDDIKLPPFVREVLDKIHFASSIEEVNDAEAELKLLVPIPSKQRIYKRLFKWVVAQATWTYIKSTDDLHELSLSQSLSSPRTPLLSETKLSPLKSSSDKPMTIAQLSKSMNQATLSSKSQSFRTLPSSSSSSSAHKSSTMKEPRGLSLSVPSRKNKSMIKGASGTLVKSKVKDVFSVLDEILAEQGLTSTTQSDSPSINASIISPRKTMSSSRSTREDKSMASVDPNVIPFAQRQSKSQVAAHEALKIGRKMAISNATHTADRLIDEAIYEYDRFYGKHRIDPQRWK